MSQDNDEIEVDISYQERETEKTEDRNGGEEQGGEQNLQPCGSRTMDKRLNPNAPAFVPGLTASILANKIIDELPSYCTWSRASQENLSYGIAYDRIWRESPFNPRLSPVDRSMTLNARAKPYVPKSQQLTELIGDNEQTPQLQQESLDHVEDLPKFGNVSADEMNAPKRGRCGCGCRIM